MKSPPKGIMDVTISVPDSLAKQAQVENLEAYLSNLVTEALQKKADLGQPSQKVPSKWAEFVDELENDPDLDKPEFKEAWKVVKKGMREVHEDLEFHHDN